MLTKVRMLVDHGDRWKAGDVREVDAVRLAHLLESQRAEIYTGEAPPEPELAPEDPFASAPPRRRRG